MVTSPPRDDDELRLRPATPEDRFQIRRWLAGPNIELWWGNAASVEAEINLAMSSDAAICRIIEVAEVAAGSAQAVDLGLLSPQEDVAPGTWEVSLFLASHEPRQRDTSRAVLHLLTEEVFATTLALACCGFVAIRNEAVARAYEQAGFRWQRIVTGSAAGPSWLMLKERPSPPPQGR